MFLHNITAQIFNQFRYSLNDFFMQLLLFRTKRLQFIGKFQFQEDVFNFDKIAEQILKQTYALERFLHRGAFSQMYAGTTWLE